MFAILNWFLIIFYTSLSLAIDGLKNLTKIDHVALY